MNSFLISARKHRPQRFDAIRGQEHITVTLRHAVQQGRLAHTFLFCGPRGTGKTTCARVLARAINCLTPLPEGEPCQVCTACEASQRGRSFNIHELDAASNNSVEDVRNLLEQMRYMPPGGKRVIILDEAHMLSNAASNALLKTLEEPPAHTCFILATTEKHKILPTIRSRCQVFDFHPLSIAHIVEELERVASIEGLRCEPTALELIASKADGALRDALSMFDVVATFVTTSMTTSLTLAPTVSTGRPQETKTITCADVQQHLHILPHQLLMDITELLCEGHLTQALLRYEEILRIGFESHLLLAALLRCFRNLLIAQLSEQLPLIEVPPSLRSAYTEQARRLPAAFLQRCLLLAYDSWHHERTNPHARTHLEVLFVRLVTTPQPELQLQPQPDDASASPPHSERPSSPAPAPKSQSMASSTPNPAPAVSVIPTLPDPPTETPSVSTVERVAQEPLVSGPATIESTTVELAPLGSPPPGPSTVEPPTPESAAPEPMTRMRSRAIKSSAKIPMPTAHVPPKQMLSGQTPEQVLSEERDPAAASADVATDTPQTRAMEGSQEEDEIRAGWEAYVAEARAKGDRLLVGLLLQPYRVHQQRVTLSLSNSLEKDALDRYKVALLAHLKRWTQREITLEVDYATMPLADEPGTAASAKPDMRTAYPVVALLEKELDLSPI